MLLARVCHWRLDLLVAGATNGFRPLQGSIWHKELIFYILMCHTGDSRGIWRKKSTEPSRHVTNGPDVNLSPREWRYLVNRSQNSAWNMLSDELYWCPWSEIWHMSGIVPKFATVAGASAHVVGRPLARVPDGTRDSINGRGDRLSSFHWCCVFYMQIVKLFAFLALIVSLLSGSAMGQSYGRRMNQYGRRLNQYGRRMNQYGRRLNQYGRRLNQYGRRMDWFSLDKIQKKFFPVISMNWFEWEALPSKKSFVPRFWISKSGAVC